MQFTRKIYQFDWHRLTRELLPVVLRKPRLVAVVEACVSALIAVRARFTNFKLEAEYDLTITPQVCYLERMLNDKFDYSQRRIKIVDGVNHDPVLLSLDEEAKPVLLATSEVEGLPVLLPLQSEVAQFSSDFVVEVPSDVRFDEKRMSALLYKYKLASKVFTIKII